MTRKRLGDICLINIGPEEADNFFIIGGLIAGSLFLAKCRDVGVALGISCYLSVFCCSVSPYLISPYY
ncbi:hypothetical protein BpHYR1_002409 [Brachionus plicatilis]|uniref:Uncharacterized protein n=1 Tax=Brachionus plicatilis TaxID=10195 RepID=A0A3M7PLI6_BRAPC|nr:hypothetical protein BpHYR1_002409 [Brachionus plicatilis]